VAMTVHLKGHGSHPSRHR